MSRVGGVQQQALFVGTGEHDGVVEGLRSVERDIGLQRVEQSRRVHLDQLRLGNVRVAASQGEEFVGVVLDGAGTTEEHDLADGPVGHGRAEALLDQLGEAAQCPRDAAPRTRLVGVPSCSGPERTSRSGYATKGGSSLPSNVGNSRQVRGWKRGSA